MRRLRLTSFLYTFYFWGERLSQGLRLRVTESGWFMLIATFVIGLSGIDTHWSLHYQIFAVMLMVLALGLLSLAAMRRPKVGVRRQCPRFATAGVELRYGVTVTSQSRRVLHGGRLREWFADTLPSRSEFVNRPEPRERERNLFDRVFVYYRWMWLTEAKRLAIGATSSPFSLAPRASVRVMMRLRPLRRGRLKLRGMRVLRRDPFGLFQRGLRLEDHPETLLILPKRYPLGQLELLGNRRLDNSGAGAAATAVGMSEEFVGLRDYRPGDAPRHIHWRSWARLNRPVVKEYEEEQLPRFALALDTYLAPGREEMFFEEAVSVAASFVSDVETRDSLLECLFVEDQMVELFVGGPGASRASERMLEVLALVEPTVDPGNVEALRHSLLRRASHLSAAILVLTEWDAPRQSMVEQLRARGIRCVSLVMVEAPRQPLADVYFLPLGEVGRSLLALEQSLQASANPMMVTG